jgi:hypothetical protein
MNYLFADYLHPLIQRLDLLGCELVQERPRSNLLYLWHCLRNVCLSERSCHQLSYLRPCLCIIFITFTVFEMNVSIERDIFGIIGYFFVMDKSKSICKTGYVWRAVSAITSLSRETWSSRPRDAQYVTFTVSSVLGLSSLNARNARLDISWREPSVWATVETISSITHQRLAM